MPLWVNITLNHICSMAWHDNLTALLSVAIDFPCFVELDELLARVVVALEPVKSLGGAFMAKVILTHTRVIQRAGNCVEVPSIQRLSRSYTRKWFGPGQKRPCLAPSLSLLKAVPPNMIIQKKVKTTGAVRALLMNSLMVLSLEILAMNILTKRLQEIQHPQQNKVQLANQSRGASYEDHMKRTLLSLECCSQNAAPSCSKDKPKCNMRKEALAVIKKVLWQYLKNPTLHRVKMSFNLISNGWVFFTFP